MNYWTILFYLPEDNKQYSPRDWNENADSEEIALHKFKAKFPAAETVLVLEGMLDRTAAINFYWSG